MTDFRKLLKESPTDPAPLQAGPYLMSLLPVGPSSEATRWEVGLFDGVGRWLTPETHPDLFARFPKDVIWHSPGDTTTAIAADVETQNVQAIYDVLADLTPPN